MTILFEHPVQVYVIYACTLFIIFTSVCVCVFHVNVVLTSRRWRKPLRPTDRTQPRVDDASGKRVECRADPTNSMTLFYFFLSAHNNTIRSLCVFSLPAKSLVLRAIDFNTPKGAKTYGYIDTEMKSNIVFSIYSQSNFTKNIRLNNFKIYIIIKKYFCSKNNIFFTYNFIFWRDL